MNKKKKQEIIINYILSLGFVLLLFLFLISLVIVSRFVLSDSNNEISNVVTSTQNLLEEIDSSKLDSPDNFIDSDFLTIDERLRKFGVYQKSYYNLKNNKSLITFKLNNSLSEVGDRILISNLDSLSKGDRVLYHGEKEGILIDYGFDNELNKTIYNVFSENIKNIEKLTIKEIDGIVLY